MSTFRFFVATDYFVETWLATDRFGAHIPNSGYWTSRASGNLDVLSRHLTFEVSSNQFEAKLLVVTESNLPIAACRD